MRLELSDLPPWARAQAEKQLAASRRDGGMNALCINACPLCGSSLGRMEADDEAENG